MIQEGVNAGDTVVTDGQLSLRPGSKVRPRGEGAGPGAPGARAGGGGRRGGGGQGRGQGKPPAS